MAFDPAAYAHLELKFREQVRLDNELATSPEGQGVYCPVREPISSVDFILVAMEPSLKGWATDLEDARKQVEKGFKNFDGFCRSCVEPVKICDSLHVFCHCIKSYLCQEGESYHLTDLAKGAMLVRGAAQERRRRYESWYPLLLEEIELVGKPNAPVIAVGKSVHAFLRKQGFGIAPKRELHAVVHYSGQAAGAQRLMSKDYPEDYERFISNELIGEQIVSEGLEDTPKDTRKRLMFTYKVQFEAIRNEADGKRS